MRFGLSTACLYPQETEKTFELYCKTGIQNVEIFLNTFSEMKTEYVRQLRSMGDAYGTRVVSVHPFTSPLEPLMLFSEYTRRIDDFLEFYRPYFEACNLFDCGIFVFHGDRKESPCPAERYFERYRRLYELGQSYGIYVAQENVVRCKSHSARFIRGMRLALGENVRFVLDTKQALRAGENLYDMVDAMGERLQHVHLSDCTAEADCLPVGKGDMDIARLLVALKACGFDENVIIELYRENFESYADLTLSLKNLEEIGDLHK